jgi:hypothetical protein
VEPVNLRAGYEGHTATETSTMSASGSLYETNEILPLLRRIWHLSAAAS